MKTIKRNLKWAAKILSFLILFQSCTVYHNYTSSVDAAVSSNNKVKLEIDDEEFPYKFKSIKVFDNEYYGLTKINSNTYKRLRERKSIDADGNFKYVQLHQDELGYIHLKNKGASTALTVAIPVVAVGVLIGIGVWAAGESVSFGSFE